ncbi:ATP-binding cassette, subfamily B (MDR/TAP), member 1 [Tremella mesenterica]|uniref:ATP-binding cassette, subfamily B (MDR/TAP), member 1 n=1 Tax=Tremella mesenterica TaxID=5217 RepID=A0A4Q1BPS7_TREME|nr:ATP-binding cassette, subfamily B (MDR/TAP), member 1 [Tremella mesenterica]
MPKLKADKEVRDPEEKKEPDVPASVGLLDLFRFSTPVEKVLMIVGLILSAACGAAQPLMTLIFGRLTSSFTSYAIALNQVAQYGNTPETAAAIEASQHRLRTDSGRDALYLLAMGLGTFICTWVFMFIWNYTGELSTKRLREEYVRAVLRQEIAYFDDVGAGEVSTRIQTDCDLVQDGSSERVALVVQYLSTFITGYVLAIVRSWRLALALASILIVLMASGTYMMMVMTKYSTISLEAIAKAGSLAEEIIGSIRTVHAFSTGSTLRQRFDGHIQSSRRAGRSDALVESAGVGVMIFSIWSAYALAFFYGGILVVQGRANSGIVVTVIMSILIGSFSMANMTSEMMAVSKAQGAAAKLYATIDRKPAIDSSDTSGLRPNHIDGTISFEGVNFHYPSRPDVPILKDFSMTFQAGHKIALVGSSGSGKSTVVSLIERFYDTVEGVIRLDGHDLKTLNLKWLRRQIGLVQQEPTLFATSVRDNVEHGLIGSQWEDSSQEEKRKLVERACRDANAHDFIVKLPNGYETIVGERGKLLSGGQKQRVAIARAIISNPRILLFDEATSALDTQSEGIVEDALDKAARGRTTITVAHRLSTIKDADLIIVMGDGQILEQGTHDTLLQDAFGPYAQLVATQNLNKANDDQDPGKKMKHLNIIDSPSSSDLGNPYYPFQPEMSGTEDTLEGEKQGMIRRLDDVGQRVIPARKLYHRLFRINSEDRWIYLLATFGRYYFITSLLAGLSIYLQIMGFSWTGANLKAKLQSRLFTAVVQHDVAWFDEEQNSTGAVTSDITGLPQRIEGLFGTTLGSIVQTIATVISGCVIGLAYGPLLALIGIACIPLLLAEGYISLKIVVLKDAKIQKLHAPASHLAAEAAGNIRTIASLTREDEVNEMYSKSLEGPRNVAIRSSIPSQALYAASKGISFLIISLVFYVGALWIISNRYSTAEFFTVLMAVIFASIQSANIFTFVTDATKANGAAKKTFQLLDEVPAIDTLLGQGIHLDETKPNGYIRLEGVHFRYPSRPEIQVLWDLTLDIPQGSYVAIVGPSGCGKSTIIQLLERFYDPLVGRITMDGVDIRRLSILDYRAQMSLVSQEPTLYSGSIRFNILLGANKPIDQVSEEELVSACKDANIYDFIMSLPDGFDTEVGRSGSQLSGGQKQRIAIARALVRNPKILLLDEATSALDSQSERVVQEALDRAAKGRTTIAIAHRLSTIQKADIIYCLAGGQVVEKGTHDELLARRGTYYELVQLQNLSRR